jgi:hypothetical protein
MSLQSKFTARRVHPTYANQSAKSKELAASRSATQELPHFYGTRKSISVFTMVPIMS